MELSKIFAVLCAFLLVICLALSITTLVVMRNAVAETTAWEGRAAALVTTLDACVSAIRAENDQAVIAPIEPDDPLDDSGFFLRAVGDRIGVFTADGYRVSMTEVETATLPQEERAQLEAGIYAKSWAELMLLMQDYDS